MFALAAEGAVIIGIVDMREGSCLEFGVFHVPDVNASRLWIAAV